ncbi:SOS response-associated peptidase [Falsigemmobacter faecalis]|uniref:Abasic site processing protein n=1 Tax=Falsigemmobacter faecalis TaxID=2488730 RepID=A0A3P3DCZ4_9RHOB|nr:SOS response-associated peptidase family protein [Falsigemmobacter faecalis]RRH72189.1 SOS response-associated peptidase [Falsigemmobacter faecalis]
MCNLYSQTRSQDAMRQVFSQALLAGEALQDNSGNQPVLRRIYPDYRAPVITVAAGGFQITTARWGMPTPQACLVGKRTDPGVTNIRNTASAHWRRWLGVTHRCLVPFDAFSEPDTRPGAARGKPLWFALGQDRPLAFFAGIHTEWTSVRRLKEGAVTTDLFGFLTTEPNREVAAVHPKAMPVILSRPEDWRRWLSAPLPEALSLQRPLEDGSLEVLEDVTDEPL